MLTPWPTIAATVGPVGSAGPAGSPIWTGTSSILLDGVDERIRYGPFWSSLVNTTEPFSFSCRVKFSTLATGGSIIQAADTNFAGSPIWLHRAVGNLQLHVYSTGGGLRKFATTSSPLVVDTWYTLLAVWSGSGYPDLYLDGSILAGTDSEGGTFGSDFDKTASNVQIGCRYNVTHDFFLGGNLRDLAWWYSDQSANAAAIHNAGTVHDYTILASPPDWYSEIGSTGDDATDTTGVIQNTANPGTNDGTPINTEAADIEADIP